jgi:hypothetical protein
VKDIEKAVEALTKKAEKEIVKNYKIALKDLKARIALLHEKYAVEGVLTYAEMAKYNRYDELIKSINANLKDITGKNAKLIKGLAAEAYQESYYRTAFFLESGVQAKLGYGLINPDTIKAAVQNPISGLTLNQTLEKNRANIILKIRQEVTQGLIKGEPYSKMAKRFTDTLGGDAYKATRVAQTEAHRCMTEGTLQSGHHAAERGVDMLKVWDATLDGKTRDSHQALDQQKVGVDDDFTSPVTGATGPGPRLMGDAAEDCNCRCSTRFEIKGYAPSKRYAREEEGKRGKVIEYTNYEDWSKAKGLKLQYI